MDAFDVLAQNEAAFEGEAGRHYCDECDFSSEYKSSLARHTAVHERESTRFRSASAAAREAVATSGDDDASYDGDDEGVGASSVDHAASKPSGKRSFLSVCTVLSLFVLTCLSWAGFFFATSDCKTDEIYCIHTATDTKTFALRVAATFAVFFGVFNLLVAVALPLVRRRSQRQS